MSGEDDLFRVDSHSAQKLTGGNDAMMNEVLTHDGMKFSAIDRYDISRHSGVSIVFHMNDLTSGNDEDEFRFLVPV